LPNDPAEPGNPLLQNVPLAGERAAPSALRGFKGGPVHECVANRNFSAIEGT